MAKTICPIPYSLLQNFQKLYSFILILSVIPSQPNPLHGSIVKTKCMCVEGNLHFPPELLEGKKKG